MITMLGFYPVIGDTGNRSMVGASSLRRQHGYWDAEIRLGLTSQRKKHGLLIRILGQHRAMIMNCETWCAMNTYKNES